jgi:hypothetical protein
MEMQQIELLSQRPFPSPIARKRSSQRCEIIDFNGALLRRRGAPIPKIEKAQPEQGLRSIAPEDIERFLNQLRGEALLIGALSYDLGLRFSQLRFLRVRDVNLTAKAIELSDGRKIIPDALVEDLKEHIHEKLCGSGAGGSSNKRDQLLFSASAFENVLVACSSFFAHRVEAEASESQVREVGVRVKDNFLRVMGWFHTKRAARRGGRVRSPLGLFEKGPRIVRRDRGGVVHSYYVWRAV